MTQEALTPEQIQVAVGMLTDLHILNAEKAIHYREQYIDVIMLFITGVSGLLAFYISQKRRLYLSKFVAALVVIMTVFALTFQLFWFKYTVTASEWSFEYRQEAVRVLTGARSVLFQATRCAVDPGQEAKKITWHKRKSMEHEADWLSMDKAEIDEIVQNCGELKSKLFGGQQLNIWLLIILTTGALGLLITYQLRRGPEDG